VHLKAVARPIASWKYEVAKEMRVPLLSLEPREWALLLLYADGQSPIKGEECFHTTYSMMAVPPFSFKPLLLSFFSPELHSAIKGLVSEGLVRVVNEGKAGAEYKLYKLSEKGLVEAARLADRVKSSWVSIGEVIFREGSKVLGEIEALKKTYNGKNVSEWLDLILKKMDSQDNIFEKFFSESEIEFLRNIYKSFKK
jgi:DNA-binding PadR family transcriptional regulator